MQTVLLIISTDALDIVYLSLYKCPYFTEALKNVKQCFNGYKPMKMRMQLIEAGPQCTTESNLPFSQ